MQSLGPLSPDKLLAATQQIAMRFEVYDGAEWLDLSQIAPAEAFQDVELDEWYDSTHPSKWIPVLGGAGTVNRDGTEVYSGDYSARIDVDASGTLTYFYQSVKLPPLHRYFLTFYYKTEAGKNAAFYMMNIQTGRYLNSSGAWQAWAAAITLPEATDWTLYELEIVTDYDGYQHNCSFASGSSSASSSIWFDKISLAPLPSYLVAGSVEAAGAGRDSEPVAGSWSVTLDNPEGIFHPFHPTSEYAGLIGMGKQARVSLGVLSREVVRFDGSDDYVEVPDAAAMDITGAITVEAWVKQTYRDTWATLVTKGTSTTWSSNNYVLGLYAGRVDFRWGADRVVVDAGDELELGAWHHVVAVVPSSGQITVWIDGVLKKYATRTVTPTANSQVLRFGSDDGYTDNFCGDLAEVRIYSRDLTEAEIAEHYRHVYQNETDLEGLWTFAEQGPVAYDDSGNDLDGYLEGAWRSRPQLLTNSGLERWASSSDCYGWIEQTPGSNTITQETTETHNGRGASAKLVTVDDVTCNMYQQVTLKPGHLHRLSFWYKSTGAARAWVYGGASFQVMLKRGAMDELEWASGSGWLDFDAAADWTRAEIVFQTHKDHNAYLIAAGISSATGLTMYLDDLSLVDLDEGEEVLERVFWQRIVGYMDNPSFDHKTGAIAISGTDYSKELADLRLYSPWTAWGSSETFDSQASPGGTGTELYAEADALEVGTGEADNITNWSVAGTGSASSEDVGNGSDYYLHFVRDVVGLGSEETVENTNVGTLAAGSRYAVQFDGRGIISDGGYAKLEVWQTVGASYELIGERYITPGAGWHAYSVIVSCTSAGACRLRLYAGGKYATSGDIWDLDNISIKLYDPDSWMIYDLDPECNGVYRVELDGEQIPEGDEDREGGWHYDRQANALYFSEDMVIDDGTANLVVYYYTDQAPENVVADLLVAAGRYATRAAALAAMDYEATGIVIERVWFEQGTSALAAVAEICARCNYRFWRSWDGTPNFKPAPALTTPAHLTLEDEAALGGLGLFQSVNEVRNHVIIEGEERSVFNISTLKVERVRWRGEAEDATSIAAYLEKTYALSSDLFQDQDSVDDMAAELLAEFKEPKYYVDLDMPFSAIPLEIGDTVQVEIPVGSVTVTKKVLVREVSVSNHSAKYLCEIFVPTNTVLTVNDASLAMTSDQATVQRDGFIETADASMAMAAEAAGISRTVTYTTAQAGASLAVPSGFTQAVIECWGPGGNGGGGDGPLGGGGGGGAYSKVTATVAGGTDTLYVYVPAGGAGTPTYVKKNDTTICEAEAGSAGTDEAGGAGGLASTGVGDTKYSGGDGYIYLAGTAGGGGGSSAGPAADGNDATSRTGATAPTGGGAGGTGGLAYNAGSAGTAPGGGGGGAGEDLGSPKSGGAGAIGKVIIVFS